MDSNHQNISTELRVVLKCASPELNPTEVSEVVALISKGIDWSLLIEFAQHHRLLPLVYTNLNRECQNLVPESVLKQLKNQYEQIIRQTLAQSAELKRITSTFHAKGLDIVLLKGWALKESLYDDVSLRQSRDIDLLVRQTDTVDADNILFKLGYKITKLKNRFKLNSHVGTQLIRRRSELDYWSSERDTYVDLHWRLSLSHGSFPIDINQLWDEMEAQGEEGMFRMPDSTHFVFLCYHGAKHCWLRFHWLNDIALLIQKDQLDWNLILTKAKELGVLPTIGLAVSLANLMFGAPIPEVLKNRRDILSKGEQLAFKMLPDMIRAPAEIEKRVQPFTDFKRIYFGYQLQTRLPYRFITWTDLLFPSVTDYSAINLPKRLSILYYIVRLALLIQKLVYRIVNTISLTSYSHGRIESKDHT